MFLDLGKERGSIRWWKGSTGFGAVVLNGTMVQSWYERRGYGEITTTGHRLITSGALNPVLKSHIGTMPVRG